MKAVLLSVLDQPPPVGSSRFAFTTEALGLGYLAAAARSELGTGVDLSVVDMVLRGLAVPAALGQVVACAPQVVGVSIPYCAGADDGLKIAQEIKRRLPQSYVVLGGHALAHSAKQALRTFSSIDAAIVGEGELAFVALLRALGSGERLDDVPNLVWRTSQGIVRNETAPLISNLDTLPFPARDDLAWALQAGVRSVTVSTSRGCYGDCAFCSVSSFYRLSPGPKWRGRSPEDVVEELSYLNRDFGVTRFRFVDDNFVGPGSLGRARAEALARQIRRSLPGINFSIACRASDVDRDLFRLLAEAGMRAVFLGVESLDDGMLDRIGKRVSRSQNEQALKTILDLGVFLEVGYISYDPDCTLEEVERSYRLLMTALGDQLDVVSGLNQRAVPFPGTPLARRLDASGRLIFNDDFKLNYILADTRVTWLEDYLSPFTQRLDALRANLSVELAQSQMDDPRIRLRMAGFRRLLCRFYETLLLEGCRVAGLTPDVRQPAARTLEAKLKQSLAELETTVASN